MCNYNPICAGKRLRENNNLDTSICYGSGDSCEFFEDMKELTELKEKNDIYENNKEAYNEVIEQMKNSVINLEEMRGKLENLVKI